MGPVFRGDDPATAGPVVVKVLRVGLPPERVAIVTAALAAMRERLAPHPALCPMLDNGVHEAEPFVVSAFVDGDSLDVALREYGPANITDALPRLRALADALDTAATAGIVHGSLHLRDIMVSPERTVLTGIGVGSALERVGVRAPVRRPYCAPEIAQGLGVSPAGDQFALAAIAHEWLSGRRIAGPGGRGLPPAGRQRRRYRGRRRRLLPGTRRAARCPLSHGVGFRGRPRGSRRRPGASRQDGPTASPARRGTAPGIRGPGGFAGGSEGETGESADRRR